jgi:hypothetical protein
MSSSILSMSELESSDIMEDKDKDEHLLQKKKKNKNK